MCVLSALNVYHRRWNSFGCESESSVPEGLLNVDEVSELSLPFIDVALLRLPKRHRYEYPLASHATTFASDRLMNEVGLEERAPVQNYCDYTEIKLLLHEIPPLWKMLYATLYVTSPCIECLISATAPHHSN